MAKNHGERIEGLEVAYAGIRKDIGEIKDHLKALNGSVADNSKFRLQQSAVLRALAFAWVSVFIPLIIVAVAVLK